MATIQASSILFTKATLGAPKFRRISPLSLPKLPSRGLVEELDMTSGYKIANKTIHIENDSRISTRCSANSPDPVVISKLYAIMEAVADRVEMHKNIGEQRNNWNQLMLNSINVITFTAATMAGLAATSAMTGGAPFVALKLSSTLLYVGATVMLVIMNKIQPSQLTEEQRNAARLFKQLHVQIQATLALRAPSITDVNEAMERVLALDRAYPLPLLGTMLKKFPSVVEPAVWWPKQQSPKQRLGVGGNGWSGELEEEMKEISGVLKRKDINEYLRLSKKALKLSKMLAISGPLLTSLAALGSAFVGTSQGSWAVIVGVISGALACMVNAIQHGGQIGMVFEMYRSNAGFFKLMEETIESNVSERDVIRRENGDVLEMKVALQLGRSLSELKQLAASSRNVDTVNEEFASKLF